MSRFLRRPDLGGVLSIVNGLSWVALVVLALNGAISSEIFISAGMVLSLPIALPFVLPTVGHHHSDGDVVSICIIIGVNTLAWGYGLAWLWQVVCGRQPLFMLLAVATIIAALFGFFLLI